MCRKLGDLLRGLQFLLGALTLQSLSLVVFSRTGQEKTMSSILILRCEKSPCFLQD